MRIAIDLDESKINTIEWVIAFNNGIIAGIPFSKDQISNYHMDQIPELKARWLTTQKAVQLFDLFLLEWPAEMITAIDGARENMRKLKHAWAELITLTARHTGLQNKTIDTIERLFPWLINDIIFANHYTATAKGKWVLCRENNMDMMIEDNLLYAEDLASKWVPVHLLEQPRNTRHDKSHEAYGIYHHKNRDAIWDAIMSK